MEIVSAVRKVHQYNFFNNSSNALGRLKASLDKDRFMPSKAAKRSDEKATDAGHPAKLRPE